MSTLNWVHWWNARICPLVGLLSNAALIFLVLNKTPKEMRIHSRILLQTAIVDILILALTCLGQPAVSSTDNVLIILFDGYFASMFENDEILISILCNIFFVFALFDIIGVTPQFIYRYLMNRGVKITFFRYLAMISAILLPHCFYFGNNQVLTLTAGKRMPLNESGIFYNEELIKTYFLDGIENSSVKYFILNTRIESRIDLFNVGFILLSLISYAAIAFCGWKISRFVNSNLTGRKKELSKQLNWNLIMLAILPIAYFLSITVFMALSATNGDMTEGQRIGIKTKQIFMSLLVHWIPLLNPLISMATNMPYRNAILKMMAFQIQIPNCAHNSANNCASINDHFK